MENMNLVVDYISMDDDVYLDINKGQRKIGEITISNDLDCHVVMIKAYSDLHIEYNKQMDKAIDHLFSLIYSYIQSSSFIDPFNKQVLLLEDENIANRFAINNDLRRVPRYCGFYLF